MPQQTGPSAFSFTPDAATQLKDAGAITSSAAAQVGGSDQVLDFGNITSGPAVEQAAYTRAELVIDVSAFDFTTGDEVASIILQLSDNASGAGTGFDASDTIVTKAVVSMGADGGQAAAAGADDESATGRVRLGVDNEHKGTVFRFARLFTVVGGTTPSINYQAWLAEPLD